MTEMKITIDLDGETYHTTSSIKEPVILRANVISLIVHAIETHKKKEELK